MKKLYTLLTTVIITASTFAQAPDKMSYQAVVRDASNNLINTLAVGMQISILQTTATGTAVYVETHTPTTNANGLVSLEVGSGTIVSGTFNTIDWSAGPYFLKTETDPTGGTIYTITGTSQLMSVPYALHANTADSIVGGISITETDPVFGTSIANGITATDTANWNNHTIDTDTHIDAAGVTALGFVAGPHTVDTDSQTLTVSLTGDTLTIAGGNSVLVPGISLLNHLPSVGDFRFGGVVIWVNPNDSTHGIVMSINDVAGPTAWFNGTNSVTGATATDIGTGQANTTTIVNSQGAGTYAAKICDDLILESYSDWFLPSEYTWNVLGQNRGLIDSKFAINGGSAIGVSYWSSSEDSLGSAHYFLSNNNFSYAAQKFVDYNVRAVRAF